MIEGKNLEIKLGMIEGKNLEIKFGGNLHEVDINLYIDTLKNYSNITQTILPYLEFKTKVELNIKIQATKEGSFEVLLNIDPNIGKLFTNENLQIAANIVTVVAGLYGFLLWISKNGKPEKNIEKDKTNFEIRNNNGNITINKNVYNIYQNVPSVRKNIRETFKSLKKETEIENFSIRDVDENTILFNANKVDFDKLASYNDDEILSEDEIETKTEKNILENQELSIFKVVFKKNNKWEFYYKGNKISASLLDKNYSKKIEKGEVAFRNGDKLIVDLEVEKVFNKNVYTFINKYSIINVLNHISNIKLEQYPLDF